MNAVVTDNQRGELASQRGRVPLLEARLDVTRYLTPQRRAELTDISLPAVDLEPGSLELGELLARHRAFAAAVIDGLVLHRLQLGEHSGIQLLGPGDVLLRGGDFLPVWLAHDEFRASARLRLALLGEDFLAAARRWPQIIEGLYGCIADQMQRLSGQLVTCQLPRVEDRVLSVLWLLAESWGQVTAGGVRLPLNLTHETIGGLIGARRPTVTLALRKLSEEGAILHQNAGWLLLKEPPPPPPSVPEALAPEAPHASFSAWAAPLAPSADPSFAYAELRETVRRLREQHTHDREEARNLLERVRTARVRMAAARDRIKQGSVRRPPLPPSS